MVCYVWCVMYVVCINVYRVGIGFLLSVFCSSKVFVCVSRSICGVYFMVCIVWYV